MNELIDNFIYKDTILKFLSENSIEQGFIAPITLLGIGAAYTIGLIIDSIAAKYPEHSILAEESGFESMIGNYDGSRGNVAFIEALAEMLQETFGWEVGPENIALTNGSQNAFFCLFNLFAGEMPDGSKKKILFRAFCFDIFV